jgi:site-specific recombinase XerD
VSSSSAAGLREHNLGGVVNEWLLTLKIEGRSPRTLKWYRQQIDMYRRRGGVERLEDLTGGELRRYIGELQDSGRADNTVRGAFLSLKCMCNWAAREGYAVDPALLRVKTPRVAEKELFTYRGDQAMEGSLTCDTTRSGADPMIQGPDQLINGKLNRNA